MVLLLVVLTVGIGCDDGKKPVGIPTTQPGRGSARPATDDGAAPAGLKPLPLELPKPAFIGTPKPTENEPNLEPITGKARPPFFAPTGVANVAQGKPVTASDDFPVIGELEMITDGEKSAGEYFVEFGPRTQWVQIDLGAEYKLFAVLVWHYHNQARVYRDVVVQLSDDPDFARGVTTLYNADHDNTSKLGAGQDKAYVETAEGRLIDAKGHTGRYLRLYSNGNTSNEYNHYVEVEAWGLPAQD